MENTQSKPFWQSTSVWSGTALLTLCLTMTSLYYKANGHALGEVIPLVILALSSYGLNIRGRIKANTQLTLGNK